MTRCRFCIYGHGVHGSHAEQSGSEWRQNATARSYQDTTIVDRVARWYHSVHLQQVPNVESKQSLYIHSTLRKANFPDSIVAIPLITPTEEIRTPK
jgi:hypothetical protein